MSPNRIFPRRRRLAAVVSSIGALSGIALVVVGPYATVRVCGAIIVLSQMLLVGMHVHKGLRGEDVRPFH
jgi:hypothetical protein